MLGQPKTARTFFKMPLIFVSYSGGFVPTAWALRLGQIKDRLRGIVLMDLLYGEVEHFENWVLKYRRGFFISGYLGSTRARNLQLQRQLADQGIPIQNRSMATSSPAAWYSWPGIPRNSRIAIT